MDKLNNSVAFIVLHKNDVKAQVSNGITVLLLSMCTDLLKGYKKKN